MSNAFEDKAKGTGNRLVGGAQEELGEATGNADQKAQGEARQGKGELQGMKGNVEQTADNAKNKLGKAVDDLTH